MRAIECALCGLTIRGHAFPWQRGYVTWRVMLIICFVELPIS